MRFASDICRVPFGRTHVLIGANNAPSPGLSYWRDLKGIPLLWVSKIGAFLFVMANWDRKIGNTMVGVGRSGSNSAGLLFSEAARWIYLYQIAAHLKFSERRERPQLDLPSWTFLHQRSPASPPATSDASDRQWLRMRPS